MDKESIRAAIALAKLNAKIRAARKGGRPRIKPTIGETFGRLRVTRVLRYVKWNGYRVVVLCECGKTKELWYRQLRNAGTISCGCARGPKDGKGRLTHGQSGTKAHNAWQAMKQRCSNQNNAGHENYGGRGIKVCPCWQRFESFIADMGKPPSKRHQLDRIDNDGDYEPGNCRWATMSEQQNNKRTTPKYEIGGITLTATQWARVHNISSKVVTARLREGWSIHRALQEPVELRRGECHHKSKLTVQLVLKARALHRTGRWSIGRLARRLGVDHRAMSDALHGRTWKHAKRKMRKVKRTTK